MSRSLPPEEVKRHRIVVKLSDIELGYFEQAGIKRKGLNAWIRNASIKNAFRIIKEKAK